MRFRTSNIIGQTWMLGLALAVSIGIPGHLAAQDSADPPSPSEPPAEQPAIPGLDEVLQAAMSYHPDIRVAEAKVRASQAELDRARLDVAQRVIDFYGQWREQQRALASAEAGLRLAEQRQKVGRPVDEIIRARERVEAGRARLRELEAQLPFLLGRPPGLPEPRADGPDEQELAEQLATTAESALESTQTLLQFARRGTIEDVYRWSRRIVDARRMLPGRRSELAAALRAHHDRMEVLVLRTTEMRDKGTVYEGDVAASRYYLLEAKLWMVQAGLGTDLSEDESG
jgi:outer membrane protein TolC